MILKLGNEGTVVRIFKTRSVCYDEIEYNGKFRKLWRTEMDKLAEFPAYESAESQMSSIQSINGGAMFTAENMANAVDWIENQMQEIDAAFLRNVTQGLMGGAAVIKRGSSDDKEYGTHPDFIPGRKVGEFIGVIRGAHEYKPKMRKKIKLPEIKVDEDKSMAKAWKEGRLEGLCDEVMELIVKTAEERGKPLQEAFTDEEVQAFFYSERKMFYLITLVIGVGQSVFENQMKDRLGELKKEVVRYKPTKKRGKGRALMECSLGSDRHS